MVGLLEYHLCPLISIWRESVCTLEYLQGTLGIAKVSNVMEELTGVTGGCIRQSEVEGEVGCCMLKTESFVLCSSTPLRVITWIASGLPPWGGHVTWLIRAHRLF